MIDGREEHDPVALFGPCVHTKRCAIHEPVGRKDRSGINLPAMTGFHPPADRRTVLCIAAVIAVNPVIQHPLQRVLHTCGWAKVHIRNPHGDPVFRRHIVEFVHHVPFRRMGALAVDNLVKIHGVLSSVGPVVGPCLACAKASRLKNECKAMLHSVLQCPAASPK